MVKQKFGKAVLEAMTREWTQERKVAA